MPSASYINFLHMRIDVLKLIDTHADYSKNQKGRKTLGHLTRSAVVMLCAAWERYNEDLLIECIDDICASGVDVLDLHQDIRATLSRKVKADKNEMKPIELAGNGWKEVWKNYAKEEVESLNTPSGKNLRKLFNQFLGIGDIAHFWLEKSSHQIDTFVSVRGNIAHNGNKAKYVRMNDLRKYQDLVINNVINIDSQIADHIGAIPGRVNIPWEKLYSKDLSNYK